VSETFTRRDHAERVREYYRQQGAQREQQRIIELLYEDKLDVFGCGCCAKSNLEDLEKLIKGETDA